MKNFKERFKEAIAKAWKWFSGLGWIGIFIDVFLFAIILNLIHPFDITRIDFEINEVLKAILLVFLFNVVVFLVIFLWHWRRKTKNQANTLFFIDKKDDNSKE
jgi:ABC-type uncharacterized transport system permease subunit